VEGILCQVVEVQVIPVGVAAAVEMTADTSQKSQVNQSQNRKNEMVLAFLRLYSSVLRGLSI